MQQRREALQQPLEHGNRLRGFVQISGF